MKRKLQKGFAIPAVLIVLGLFGFLEVEATKGCATNALVKSASCK